MSKLKIIIILIALFFVVGQKCELGKNKEGISEDDFSGTKGIVLSFVDGLPPKEVWKGIDFGIWLDVHNRGFEDVSAGRVCIGSLPNSIFTKSDSCLELGELSGRKNFPGGEIKTYGETEWDGFSVDEDYKVNVDTGYPIVAKTCYEYSTSLAPLICIRDLTMNEREAVCNAGEIKLGSKGQGAPVSVTYLKEDIIPRGDENELFFTFKIKNEDDGEVIKAEKIGDDKDSGKCSFERKDKNKVNIEIDLPGFGKGSCKNGGEVVLINGEGQAFCSGIKVPKGESFSLPLNIKLTYGYLSHIRGEFTIKKDITSEAE